MLNKLRTTPSVEAAEAGEYRWDPTSICVSTMLIVNASFMSRESAENGSRRAGTRGVLPCPTCHQQPMKVKSDGNDVLL
ncbi:MAG: hypothetical protein J0M26_02415 [Planctomycetes bacterium]|nr:hypothetical protein [Planctomycetota bacterium]